MMSSGNRVIANRLGIEENTLAILDALGAEETPHADDDRITFLEAVRASSLTSENAAPPTKNMMEAVFQILRVAKSMELIITSYQLLYELDQLYPRSHGLSSSASPELVLAEEAWLPFVLDSTYGESEVADKNSTGPLDSSGFNLLIKELAEAVAGTSTQALDTKALRNMLIFQYLVSYLEGDCLARNNKYKETMNWILLRESSLNMLLGSRRISYKGLMKDCLSITCSLNQVHFEEDSVAKPSENCSTAVAIALLEVRQSTCIAMQKLLLMIMELDVSKKKAEKEGYTTRADGVRTPLVEIILDELTYDTDKLSPFLQAFNEPRWKLEIILQYFWKYMAKPSVRTRRSNGSKDDATLGAVLRTFSNNTSTKSIIKKIGVEVVQLLLAHAFEAHLSSSQQPAAGIIDSKGEVNGSSVLEVCNDVISAFRSLRGTDENMEILPIGKEALCMAAAILSTKS